MLNQKNINFLNSLSVNHRNELMYLGYTVLTKLSDKALKTLKFKTREMLSTIDLDYSTELNNLINNKDVKLISNDIVRSFHTSHLVNHLEMSIVDAFPVAHIFKPFGLKSDIWHQDASIVDETIDFSLNAWTPFVNSNKMNGCIWVLPGSHISEVNYRQFGYNPIEDETAKILKKHMIPIHVKAGEILLFYRNLIHGSSVNYLPKTRIAVESIIVPKNVQFYNYHRDQALLKDSILAYKVDMEHFLQPVPKQDFYDGKYEFEVFPDYGKDWVKDYLIKNISNFKNHENQFYSQIS